jgi:hypothetical protein
MSVFPAINPKNCEGTWFQYDNFKDTKGIIRSYQWTKIKTIQWPKEKKTKTKHGSQNNTQKTKN